jgi:heptosyltransferase-1
VRQPLTRLHAHRIAIVKPSALGDIVHALPVLFALRTRFPDAHISWIVNTPLQPLLAGHPDLDATIGFDRASLRGGVVRAMRYLARFGQQLRQARFDLVLDLQGLLRSGLMTWATAAPRRVGLAEAREGARLCYTDLVAAGRMRDRHAVERNWRFAEALGVGDLPKRFDLPRHAAVRAALAARLAGLPRPWLVVAVGSQRPTKRWPAASFAALIRHAHQRAGGSAIFIGSAHEAALARVVIDALPGVPTLDLSGRTSLPELVELTRLADGVLANDTGPLHLAAALGRPVVAPYTCTLARLHGPYGPAGLVPGAVETNVWCKGSYRKRCGRLDCMTELQPARLLPVLDEVLRTWPSRCRSA